MQAHLPERAVLPHMRRLQCQTIKMRGFTTCGTITCTECYAGSTIQDLSVRMAEHRKFYKQYLEGKKNNYTSFDSFKKYGVENCRIELEETYPCNNQEELMARQGIIIRKDTCVNRHVNGRTHKEWYVDNKAEERHTQKQHHENT